MTTSLPKSHTPGPWSFDRDWHRIPTIFAADGRTMVATVEKGTCSRDATPSADRVANANLIAAAPFMFETLQAEAAFLDAMADLLDEWASGSERGGWSTHQVAGNRVQADNCRRRAAQVRAAIRNAQGRP